MARVFLARQQGPMGFQKIVVIKTIHPHLSRQDHFVKMFLDEARIAAQLSHPNVVQVYDLGVEGGVYFIVMEYLPGEAMTAVITHGVSVGNPLSPLMAANIVAKTAGGLHSAQRTQGHER